MPRRTSSTMNTKTPGSAPSSFQPRCTMVFLAFLYQLRGATRRPKMPFLALMSDPGGTPGRPSRGGQKYTSSTIITPQERGRDIEDTSCPSLAGRDAQSEMKT